jgi:Domain of unknown function (DUF4279)
MGRAKFLVISTTKTEVEADPKAFVTLRFAGDELNPEEISAILPVEPSRAHRKGEAFFSGAHAGHRPGRTGIWFFATDHLVRSDDLRDHLQFVEQLLCPTPGDRSRTTKLRAVLQYTRSRAHVTCFWRGDPGETVPRIPARFKAAIEPLAADIETDFSAEC